MKFPHILFFSFFAVLAIAEKQCSKGPCCNISKGTFKSKGSKCSKSSNECLVAAGTCSGFSANCARMNAENGTKCSKGVCFNGSCVSKSKAAKLSKVVKEDSISKDNKVDKKSKTKVTSAQAIDNDTKALKVKVSSELEKVKTLLSSVTLAKAEASAPFAKALAAIEESIKLQNTENAEKLTINSSKSSAQLQVAIAQLKSVVSAADAASAAIINESISVLEKAVANIKSQKKLASANMKGKSPKRDARMKDELFDEKAEIMIKNGLPVLTKAALNAANKLEVLQNRKLVKLAAQELVAQKLEKMRIIDEEVHRINKKARSARLNSLRMFEKTESKDIDAQNLKNAARNIVDSDPEMKMRYFTGLTKILLDSNREKFIARDRKKLPNEEKYADDFAKEHEIIRRNEESLVQSGYFGEKYGRANITLPEEDSTTVAPSLTAILLGQTGGVNWAAVFLFIFAGILVVVIIFAIIGRIVKKQKSHKKHDDEDEDSYEQF